MADNYLRFDPTMPIPEGLQGASVGTTPPADQYDASAELRVSENDIDMFSDIDLMSGVSDSELEVPGSIIILSQEVRTAPDGTQVVDIVIDVDEVFGASEYEFRVTPG